MDNWFEYYMAARCTINNLKRTIDEFKSGERYIKLQKDYHRVTVGYIKEIKRLRKEVGSLNARIISTRNMWADDYYDMYDELRAEIRGLEETIQRLEDQKWETERQCNDKIARLKMEYAEKLYEKDCVIEKLENELAHATALLSHDGTNTSLPTSQTPPDKKKRIPNTRTKSDKTKGGQIGHEKHALEAPDEAEITDVVEHGCVDDDFACPKCGGEDYIPTGESEVKYEYDVEINVKNLNP